MEAGTTRLGRSDVRALVDTGALLALSHSRDQNHERAKAVSARHRSAGGSFTGTTVILTELHTRLLYARGAAGARTALRHLLDDPAHTWVAVDIDLVQAARTEWLERYSDQTLSLVDAVSFEIMRREGITQAFAFDHHFVVAGFELLR